MDGWSCLPQEILIEIFCYLKDEKDLYRVSQVCKLWKDVANTNQVWFCHYFRKFCCEKAIIDTSHLSLNRYSYNNNNINNNEEYNQLKNFLDKRHSQGNTNTNTTTTTTTTTTTLDDPFYWKTKFMKKLRHVRRWKMRKLKETAKLLGHTEPICCLAMNQSILISGSYDKTIRIWDRDTLQCIRTIDNNNSPVLCLQLGERPFESTTTTTTTSTSVSTSTSTTKSTLIVSGSSDRAIRIWDLATGSCLKTIRGHLGAVQCLQVDENLIVTGSKDTKIKVWDFTTIPLGTGGGDVACKLTLNGHKFGVNALQFDKDKEKLVSGSDDRTIKLWDLDSATCLRSFQGHMPISPIRQTGILCLQFQGNQLIVGSSDGYLEIYDLATLKLIRSMRGHNGGVTCLRFDDQKVVTGGRDSVIKVWDKQTWGLLYTLVAHRGGLTCLQFDHNSLVSGSNDKTIIAWTPTLDWDYSPNSSVTQRTQNIGIGTSKNRTLTEPKRNLAKSLPIWSFGNTKPQTVPSASSTPRSFFFRPFTFSSPGSRQILKDSNSLINGCLDDNTQSQKQCVETKDKINIGLKRTEEEENVGLNNKMERKSKDGEEKEKENRGEKEGNQEEQERNEGLNCEYHYENDEFGTPQEEIPTHVHQSLQRSPSFS